MLRFWYAFTQGYYYRACLRKYIFVLDWRIRSVTQLTPEWLVQRGIKQLVLDFDGVLAPHAAAIPLPEVVAWLREMGTIFGFAQMSIFSNKPLVERLDFFKTHFPDIAFIRGVPKKPYPDGLLQRQAQTGVARDEILLVDDRLLTGMLAVCISGTKGIYITSPYQDFKKNPIKECFFEILRRVERWVYRG